MPIKLRQLYVSRIKNAILSVTYGIRSRFFIDFQFFKMYAQSFRRCSSCSGVVRLESDYPINRTKVIAINPTLFDSAIVQDHPRKRTEREIKGALYQYKCCSCEESTFQFEY